MSAAGHYRRMLIAVESCESGSLGQGLDAPGALMITAASPVENSLSTNYDPSAVTWLADQFSYQLWQAEVDDARQLPRCPLPAPVPERAAAPT